MVFVIHNLEGKLFVCRKKRYCQAILQIVNCVVLRKRCIKAPKKMHYSQLVILFRFTKQNQLDITLTLPLIYRATAAPCPLPPPGAWTDKTTHMTSNKPIRIFCWFVQPTCGLSPTHLRLAPTSVYTHLLRAAAIPTWLAPTSVYTHLCAFAPSAVKMMKMFSWFAGAFSICMCFLKLQLVELLAYYYAEYYIIVKSTSLNSWKSVPKG